MSLMICLEVNPILPGPGLDKYLEKISRQGLTCFSRRLADQTLYLQKNASVGF